MRSFASVCVIISLVAVTTGQRGRGPQSFPGFQEFSGFQEFPSHSRFPTGPLIGGSADINSPTPIGPRGCFCLPPNQQCDSNGVIPQGSTRISEIDTKIINLSPDSRCPQGQNECCFGSGVGVGTFPPFTSPVKGCGGSISLIPGKSGTAEADFGEYPWMTAIVTPNNKFVAGGVLIHPAWVLTAAHKVTEPGQLKVRLGDYDLSVSNEFPKFPHQEVAVAQVIYHPSFNPKNLLNDVALLRLQKPVTIRKHINAACLPEKGQLFTGQRCFVSGWGQNVDGNFQKVLKEVDLPIVEEFDCEARLRRTRLGDTFQLDKDSFLCAGGEAGKDACGGDGGSPLVCQEGGIYTVVGLVAWGIGCGQDGVPGVYVNIPSFAEFIENQLSGNQG